MCVRHENLGKKLVFPRGEMWERYYGLQFLPRVWSSNLQVFRILLPFHVLVPIFAQGIVCHNNQHTAVLGFFFYGVFQRAGAQMCIAKNPQSWIRSCYNLIEMVLAVVYQGVCVTYERVCTKVYRCNTEKKKGLHWHQFSFLKWNTGRLELKAEWIHQS